MSGSDFEYDAVEIENEGIFDLWDVITDSEHPDSSENDEELIPIAIVSENESEENVQTGGGQNMNESNNELSFDSDSDSESDGYGYQIIRTNRRRFPRYNITGEELVIKFNDMVADGNVITWMRHCFDGLIKRLITERLNSGEIKLTDRVAIVINSSDCFEPINISFRRPDQISTDVILTRISIVANSNKDFFLNQNLTIDYHHIRMPIGHGGPIKLRGVSLEEYTKRKYGFISYKFPPNYSDSLCLAYSLVLAMAHANGQKNKLRSYKRYFQKLKIAARDLCTRANVDLSQGGGYSEVDKFQNYLRSEYAICVYGNRYGNDIFYETVKNTNLKRLNLLFGHDHFYAISNCTAAFVCSSYCEPCHKEHNNRFDHRCPYRCNLCFSDKKCDNVPYEKRTECLLCNRRFNGVTCFLNHLKLKVCEKFKVCHTCDKMYNTSGNVKHKCGFHFCTVCVQMRPLVHDCFMPKYTTMRDYDEVKDEDEDEGNEEEEDEELHNVVDSEPKKGKKKNKKHPLFIFFDLETTQDSKLSNSSNKYEHVPNLCVANNVCKWCIDKPDPIDNPCTKCGDRVHVFEGITCVEDFMQYIFRNPHFDKFKTVTIIAHNLGLFDGHFILKHIYNHGGYGKPKLIMNGTKILLMTLGLKYKFIDSLNYFSTPLSKLPKMFNFPEQKGHYPVLFNTLENYGYRGEIPDIKYFCPDSKKPEDREDLLVWYQEQKDAKIEFNNRLELIKYCKMDVEILRKACSEFRRTFWGENKIDPFIDASTIAGACNKVFRANYLKEDTIGIVPKGGYRYRDNQSLIALKWLCWMELDNSIIIQHAGRGPEVNLDGIGIVDGFHSESNTVYEFLGDYYHGCEDCYPIQCSSLNSSNENEMFARRERTEKKLEKIRQAGYNLVVKKECEFRRELREDPGIEICLWDNPYIVNEPLKPRHALYGGRTNANKLHYKVRKGEKIKYADINSLYPFINKRYKCPVGHPRVHVGESECRKIDLNTVEGLIKCTVLGARKLLFPVLPCHAQQKLLFYTCRICARKQKREDCTHNCTDRSFSGTWVADELRKALEKGYKVLELHEIWEYNVVQYDPETRTHGVFSEYINNFFQIKTEASGFPKDCISNEQKAAYINEFEKREGIKLRKEKIAKNSGRRSLGKTMCNSFWGKFGQRSNKSKTEIIDQSNRLFQMLTDPDLSVESILPINDKYLAVNYSTTDDASEPLNHVNVVIAAYTTAGARLELYKYLEALGDRVLYYDTDSVVFVERPGDKSLPTGNFLGDMTDELEEYGPGSYIVEFVSGGPKNYAFKVYSPTKNQYSFVCKVKGISLSHSNSNLVNFDSIKKIICEENATEIILEDNKILRSSVSDVYSTKRKKTYRMCYTKRMRLTDGVSTHPWGY